MSHAQHLLRGRTSLLPSSRTTGRFVPFTSCNASRKDARRSLFGSASTVLDYQCAKLACVAQTAEAETAAAPPAAPAQPEVLVSALDMRVGKILKCEKHPEADSLYVEEIDVGEAEGPRTIVSGLVSFVPLEEMQDRRVVVLCNLKPRNMRGVKSNGMVLCASNAAHDKVEPLSPPADAPVGERVWFGEGNQNQPAAAEPNRVQKKKMWEAIQPELKTDDAGAATHKGNTMLTSCGPVTAPTLQGASIS